MRILVISNLGLVRHTIEQAMLLDSHSVTTSEGFLQAVDVLRRDHSIDLIITDWSIKGGTAFDLYQSLRQIDRVTDNGSAPEPFFLVTIQPDRGVSGPVAKLDGKLESMIALEVAATVMKPINRDDLRTRVKTIEQLRKCKLSQPAARAQAGRSQASSDTEESKLEEVCQQLESLLDQVHSSEASARKLLNEIAKKNDIS